MWRIIVGAMMLQSAVVLMGRWMEELKWGDVASGCFAVANALCFGSVRTAVSGTIPSYLLMVRSTIDCSCPLTQLTEKLAHTTAKLMVACVRAFPTHPDVYLGALRALHHMSLHRSLRR